MQSIVCKCFCLFYKTFMSQQRIVFSKQTPPLPHLAELCFNFDDSLECQITFVSGRLLVFEKKVAMCFSSSIKTKAPHFDQFYQILFSKKENNGLFQKKSKLGGLRIYFFEPPSNFSFFKFTP